MKKLRDDLLIKVSKDEVEILKYVSNLITEILEVNNVEEEVRGEIEILLSVNDGDGDSLFYTN